MERLINLFKKAENNNIAVLMVGKFGIGKSSIVYEYAKIRSKELNRKLVIWHQLTEAEKQEVLSNVQDYYVLVDIKGSMISLDNLILPKFNDSSVVWITPLWVKLFEKPESAGILFIDEINMTPPSLQSLLFELILQRKIAETSLKSKNLLIVTAGNDLESNEFANEIPKPLINRMLIINFDKYIDWKIWVQYAVRNNIDKRIIDYVIYKRSIFTKAKESLKQSTTPRSLEMLSKMIKDSEDLEYIRMCAEGLLEESDASEFIAFLEKYHKLRDIKKYIKNLEEFSKLENEEKIIVTLKLVDYYQQNEISEAELQRFVEYLIDHEMHEFATTLLVKLKEIDKELVKKWYLENRKIAELIEKVVFFTE